jgi:hypothetical protein
VSWKRDMMVIFFSLFSHCFLTVFSLFFHCSLLVFSLFSSLSSLSSLFPLFPLFSLSPLSLPFPSPSGTTVNSTPTCFSGSMTWGLHPPTSTTKPRGHCSNNWHRHDEGRTSPFCPNATNKNCCGCVEAGPKTSKRNATPPLQKRNFGACGGRRRNCCRFKIC